MSIMLDDPWHIPKGADGELLGKIMADSAALSTDKALERLYVSREKQKIILKREQETAMKKLLAGHDVMVILPTGFGKSLIFTRKDVCDCGFPFKEHN